MNTTKPWEIVRGDCIEVLRRMPDESVDAIITDPPYASGGKNESQRRSSTGMTKFWKGAWFAGDAMGTEGLVWLLRAMAFEAERILLPGASLLVFCDWRMWSAITPAMESAGLTLQTMIVWDKGSPGTGVGFRATHELVAHLRKAGPPHFHAADGSNVIRVGRVHGPSKVHPTEKPVPLMESLIRIVSPRGGLVVDPFCGSGSTGVAALRLGRRFIGVERDPRYIAIAEERLAGVREQLEIGTVEGKQETLL